MVLKNIQQWERVYMKCSCTMQRWAIHTCRSVSAYVPIFKKALIHLQERPIEPCWFHMAELCEAELTNIFVNLRSWRNFCTSIICECISSIRVPLLQSKDSVRGGHFWEITVFLKYIKLICIQYYSSNRKKKKKNGKTQSSLWVWLCIWLMGSINRQQIFLTLYTKVARC